jgi:hypothetical protein
VGWGKNSMYNVCLACEVLCVGWRLSALRIRLLGLVCLVFSRLVLVEVHTVLD